MTEKRLSFVVAVVLAAGFLGSVALMLSRSSAPDPGALGSIPAPALPAAVTEIPAVADSAELPPLPPELQGLEPQTELATDKNGSLIPSQALRVLFDFFLANIDQEPLTTVLQRIRAALDTRLAEPAKSQALDLLQRYVGYRIAIEERQQGQAGAITDQGFDLEALKQRQADLQALRLGHFARPEIEAFFGADAQLDDYTLARIEIQQDPALAPTEKQRRLRQLDHQLPDPLRVARKRAVIHGELYQQTRRLQAEGVSASELYALRATELGETAATQLAELDRQQQQWQARLSHYQQQRTQILQAGLSEADRRSAIDNLRNDLFTGPERLRVWALDADQP